MGLNPSNFNPDVADTNCDASIDIVDALLIAQFYVGLITGLPGCTGTLTPTPSPIPETSPIPTPSAGKKGIMHILLSSSVLSMHLVISYTEMKI